MNFKIAKFVFLFKNKLYQAVTFRINDYFILTQKYYFC